jgi:hypothetical protein
LPEQVSKPAIKGCLRGALAAPEVGRKENGSRNWLKGGGFGMLAK